MAATAISDPDLPDILHAAWQQKAFQQPLSSISWCPNKDFVAILFENGDVQAFRLGDPRFSPWDRVCTFSAAKTGPVTALAWRPDGTVLALGYECGTVRLYRVEPPQLVHEFRTTQSEVSCLVWTAEESTGTASELNYRSQMNSFFEMRDISNHLPRLIPYENRHRNNNSTIGATIDKDENLNVLFVGDEDGVKYISSIYGIIHLGAQRVGGDEAKASRILNASISPDLSLVSILHAAPTSTSSREVSRCFLSTFGTGQLYNLKKDIRVLAWRSTHLDHLLNYINEGVRALAKEAEKISKAVAEQTDIFDAAEQEHSANPAGFPTALVSVLLTCIMSQSFTNYLVHKIKERLFSNIDRDFLRIGDQKMGGYPRIGIFRHDRDHHGPSSAGSRISSPSSGEPAWISAKGGYFTTHRLPSPILPLCNSEEKNLGLDEQQVQEAINFTELLIKRTAALARVLKELRGSAPEFMKWLGAGTYSEPLIMPLWLVREEWVLRNLLGTL
ncbi:hypothetical protein BDK51DRAFT_44063 [Blyttiomyces helicus]|uniref:Anaphase-promoting complex subunit 4 n=1 Tax=Blyttiomyces helicus TaxID=388810 RepID=A0A4P9WLM1_9FUNG|nr:hypothetical protein BDK51DRAFT_44063 [Blyttiomyces helicus]|eukprot:RKO93075.1 hypothetical protein BDK51DRAFT_44063 [Blyttiomyces helicus]